MTYKKGAQAWVSSIIGARASNIIGCSQYLSSTHMGSSQSSLIEFELENFIFLTIFERKDIIALLKFLYDLKNFVNSTTLLGIRVIL